jgi:DNA-binding MarR family transcriptional regulator
VAPSVIDLVESLAYESVGMTALAFASHDLAVELTISQWRVLVETGRQDAIRVGELAQRLAMSLPSTSRLVRRLERAQLITTTHSETDRRVVLVSSTAEGTRVRKAVATYRRGIIERALADRPLPGNAENVLDAIVAALRAYL